MTELIITRGYPGSGKTTFAREWVAVDPESRVRVNRDDLRWNMFGLHSGLTFPQEQAVTTAQQASVRALLGAGKSVIVDDTHLRLRFARQWADLALEMGVEFTVHDIEVDAETCILRDSARDRVIGEDAIRRMAQKFPMPWRPVEPSQRTASHAPVAYHSPGLHAPACWLVDVDGTLALMGDRSPYDITTVINDAPNPPILELVGLAGLTASLVIMSGRDEAARDDTESWLNEHLGEGKWAELHMRPAGDNRKDFIVKAELFDRHVRNRWNVLGVFDDRTQVVNMWRSIGLTCLQVAEGNF